ncbi:hypothetical protein GP5015_1482 [gamma proteobacterium HTCC5015]|nr:hypothetical protein GP5015_1482 [gamma proteobacterium HTCC5015]
MHHTTVGAGRAGEKFMWQRLAFACLAGSYINVSIYRHITPP